jgi:hypothetical protein
MRILSACLICLLASQTAQSQRPAAIDGLWASEGYGYFLEIRADSLKTFEITKGSCIPSYTAAKTTPTVAGALGAFKLTTEPVVFTILSDAAPNRARVHMGFTASDMVIRRIDRRPAVCDTPTPDTPVSNFDVFAANFAEHYPFFAEKGVDWAAVVATNRARVTNETTPPQLFAVLTSMIAPLRDAHTGISARAIQRSVRPVRQTPSFLPAANRNEGYALASPHLAGGLHAFCNGKLEFGMLAPDIGYLRIRTFSGYTADNAFDTGLAALEAALDTIFRQSRDWKGFVIDVRLNTGGADPYGLAIARRLTNVPYTAYAKQARSDPNDATKWTPEQPSVVRPTDRPSFHGPVVELIGVQSVSAAETFTQALLKRPGVTRVGENTQGVFSDVLGRTLPNGWEFVLPNERFVTDGKSYDVVGIAADVAVESFTPAARATGRDAGIEKAIEILRRPR